VRGGLTRIFIGESFDEFESERGMLERGLKRIFIGAGPGEFESERGMLELAPKLGDLPTFTFIGSILAEGTWVGIALTQVSVTANAMKSNAIEKNFISSSSENI